MSFQRAFFAMCVLVVCVACGGGGNPIFPPASPSASLSLPGSSIADTAIRGSVSVSGCDSVLKVSLLDGTRTIKDVVFSGNPTTFEVLPNELTYTTGIAANIGLVAQVSC